MEKLAKVALDSLFRADGQAVFLNCALDCQGRVNLLFFDPREDAREFQDYRLAILGATVEWLDFRFRHHASLLHTWHGQKISYDIALRIQADRFAFIATRCGRADRNCAITDSGGKLIHEFCVGTDWAICATCRQRRPKPGWM